MNDGLVFQDRSTGLWGGQVPMYTFPSNSFVAATIRSDPDFQDLIIETLQVHKTDVAQYFSNNPASLSSTFYFQAIRCRQAGFSITACQSLFPHSSTSYDTSPANQVDQPPLFPCASAPSLECDLTFTRADLQSAFGRVGYNFTVVATITRPSADSQQFTATNVGLAPGVTNVNWGRTTALPQYIYDIYQWNPSWAQLDHMLASIQAGFNTLGTAGQVFESNVLLATPTLQVNEVAGQTAAFAYQYQ
jgi:hypothetical protein